MVQGLRVFIYTEQIILYFSNTFSKYILCIWAPFLSLTHISVHVKYVYMYYLFIIYMGNFSYVQ